MSSTRRLLFILFLSFASCGRDDAHIEDERIERLTTQVNAVSLATSVTELPLLVLSSKNLINFDSTYLGEKQNFTLSVSGGEITALTSNQYILKPTSTSFSVTPTIKRAGGDVALAPLVFPVMGIPKPTFSASIAGIEYDGHSAITASEKILVKVIPNADYLFLFPDDNKYEVENIHLYASRGVAARAHIHTFNFAGEEAKNGLEVELGTLLNAESAGTTIFLEIEKLTLTNHAGEKIEIDIPSMDRNLTFIIQ